MELEPIDPETALELYIAEKETAVSDATVYSHKSQLGFFVEWCDERGIENLNELTGRRPVNADEVLHAIRDEASEIDNLSE